MKPLLILALAFLSFSATALAGVSGSYRVISDRCFDSADQVCSKYVHIEPKEIDVWLVAGKKQSEDRLSIKYKSIANKSSFLLKHDPTAIQGYFANTGTFACGTSNMECHYDVSASADAAYITGPDNTYQVERREHLLQVDGNKLTLLVRKADTKKLEREMIFIRSN